MSFDPFRLDLRTDPEPVSGDLPPPIRLVEEDDLLHHDRLPRWMRLLAGLLAIVFALSTALTSAATLGRYSLLTDAGNWPLFEGALPEGR
ncbi:MAG: hypothetical protein H6739_04215 [Alphaproteobacteria bacterium]|nr:hypothetical protein [Alphaproteobacteria bacterium]